MARTELAPRSCISQEFSLSSEDDSRDGAAAADGPDSDSSPLPESPPATESAPAATRRRLRVTGEDGVPTIIVRSDAGPDPVRVAALFGDAPSVAAAAPVITPDAPPPPPSPALERALEKMREVFKIRDLRPGQAEIIESVLAGRDTLAVMPTGSGKSLTYQLPALVLPGPTLVVSPLLALIEDQYTKLKAAGVAIVRIDSTRSAKERAADLAAVRDGTVKILMTTPESVNSPTLQEALEGVKFSLFCVDEAHCVSQWGHDFRPAYLGLRRAVEVLGRPPILGLTATATPAISDDVLVQMGMKDANVCRVSFHRPNLAFDVRKVAGEGDKLRQLGDLIKRLRRPGIVYCSTVRAVDDLYVALRHGKIPVERYNGKMTTAEREASQASFMQNGRKVVMIATNAFGLGIDKPDIRYIIHYQMPGSPEAYIQEAGRAGRDGKPARCVLLNQPDDLAIQEHFLKEAHPTKAQARMVAEGLYAWSDEGKEVSVRDLAMSLALPERRVRVILSVLEAMGVAREIKAARWEGVEPKPTREQIDKAASVFEARRISDRRRLESLLKYMNTQSCRVQMMRAYFGEPQGAKCGLCDSCAGLDSEVFDLKADDQRTGLLAATDFHARPRRRRRGGRPDMPMPTQQTPAVAAAPRAPIFESQIPGEVQPPLPPYELPALTESELSFSDDLSHAVWGDADAVQPLAGEPLHEDGDAWLAEIMAASAPAETPAPFNGVEVLGPATPVDGEASAPSDPSSTADAGADPFDAFGPAWAAIRDANIRPYVDWRPSAIVSLPMLQARPAVQTNHGANGGRPQQHHQGHQGRPNGIRGNGGGGNDRGPERGGGGGGGDRGRRNKRRGRDRDHGSKRDPRDRERGPRLPGFYNPGGD
ncbi:MAG: ATP-dependent helicase, RecQ family [Myxococcales bacterium]|nr:ATP-dependent helicase, RecQ family [Myxococcales bacterium]